VAGPKNEAQSVPSNLTVFNDRQKIRMRHLYSSIGLLLGFVALCLAAFESHLLAAEPVPKPDKRGVLEIGAGNRTLTVKLRKEEPPPRKLMNPVRVSYTVLGLAAIGLGTVSWIKKEHIRMSGGAAALGLLAVAWQWVLIGVCIAIVVFIIANLSA
jgi:hypothetical protein